MVLEELGFDVAQHAHPLVTRFGSFGGGCPAGLADPLFELHEYLPWFIAGSARPSNARRVVTPSPKCARRGGGWSCHFGRGCVNLRWEVKQFLVVFSLLPALAACERSAASDAGPPIGDPGRRLRFDASMLGGADAGPRVDDAGRRDAGDWDAGPPDETCSGVARSCILFGSITCETQRGCRLNERCDGFSTSCYSLFDSFSCSSQDGCFWSSSRRECSGSAWSCGTYSGSSTCTSQRGCSWRSDCDGVATSCSLLSRTQCEGQEGCYLR